MDIPSCSAGRPKIAEKTSRIPWRMAWRFAKDMLIAHFIAEKYCFPSGESKGAQASSLSAMRIPYFFSMTRRKIRR